jgi:NADPH:quinone reductase-like Zn-dependent oxidoreductase
MLWAPMLSPFVGHKLGALAVKHNSEDLMVLKGLIEAGKVTPVIGRTYPLIEVPDAMHDLEQQGHTRGKIVITV